MASKAKPKKRPKAKERKQASAAAAQPRPEVTATVTELPDSRVKVEAEVPAAEVERQMQATARAIGADLKLPGFRKGHVPPEVVLQRLGREAVLEEMLKDSFGGWYEDAVIEARLATVGDPKLDIAAMPEPGEPLKFTFEVGVRPPARLGDYKGLEVGRREPEVPQAAIDQELEAFRQSLGHLEPVEKPLADGDFAILDFVGTVDGEPFEGGQARDQLLEIGSSSLVPGFEPQLVGASAGEERDVEIEFPADYRAEDLAGKQAVFHVTVKAVQEKHLPELDDELADDNTEFETLEALRADIEARLRTAQQASIDDEFREAAVDSAVREAKVEVPEQLAHARAHEMWHSVARQLAQQGINPEQYLKISGKGDEEELVKEMEPEAIQALKREAVLAAVADAEEITVSDEELLEGLRPIAARSDATPEAALEQLKAAGRDDAVREDLRIRKAVDVVTEAATPIDVETAQAREKLWTPEKEEEQGSGQLWTPGSD